MVQGLLVKFYREGVSFCQVRIDPIESLEALTNTTILMEELSTWQDYGAACDTLRL